MKSSKAITQKRFLSFQNLYVSLVLSLFYGHNLSAQMGVNSTGTAPQASAMLDVSSTNKGVLIPRMTTAQRDGINSPATGLQIYNTTNNGLEFYNGTVWASVSGTGGSQWTTSGNNIYSSNVGNVGIGVSNPDFPLVSKGRIRIRDSGNNESAGIWFNKNGNSTLNTFIGIDPSNNFGIYSPILNKNMFTADMTTGGVRIEGPNVANSTIKMLSLGGYGKVEIDAPGIVGGRLSILENGNVGIGVGNPSEKLEIAGNVKINNGYIHFWNPTVQSHSISSSGGYLRLGGGDALNGEGVWINNTGSIFGGIKFKTNSSIAINDNEGAAGQVLTSGGGGNSVSWSNVQKPIRHFTLSSTKLISNNNETFYDNILTFTLTSPGTIIIFPRVRTYFGCTNPLDHCYLSWTFKTYINGINIPSFDSNYQQTLAYFQFYEERSMGPFTLTLSAGTHTISFTSTLNSIAAPPTLKLEALVQFIPD
jgi:hypothetical protein